MNRKSKIAFARQSFAKQAEITALDQEISMDEMARLLNDSGFQQVMLPPVEDGKLFKEHEVLKEHFPGPHWEVSGEANRAWIMPPTGIFGILKKYLGSRTLRGHFVTKWYYVYPFLHKKENISQFEHEIGIFVLGDESPLAYAQMIQSLSHLLNKLGLTALNTEIASLGCKSCQSVYRDVLARHLEKSDSDLCHGCLDDLALEPLAVWSCDKADCRAGLEGAPQIVDFLDETCRAELISMLESLDELGLSYTLSPGITGRPFLKEKVAFRLTDENLTQLIGSGGNFSHWNVNFGQQERVPAIGFVTTMEKLNQLIPADHQHTHRKSEVFVLPLGEAAMRKALLLCRMLQEEGVIVAESMLKTGGIKNQLKEAADEKAEISLIIGQKEALDETVILRDMRSGMQEVFRVDRIIEEVKKRLGR